MVRKYKKKGTRTQDVDEESIKLAVDDVMRRRYGIPRSSTDAFSGPFMDPV